MLARHCDSLGTSVSNHVTQAVVSGGSSNKHGGARHTAVTPSNNGLPANAAASSTAGASSSTCAIFLAAACSIGSASKTSACLAGTDKALELSPMVCDSTAT